jgi:hypothetical protein
LEMGATGALAGTPLAVSDNDFEVEVRDGQGRSVSKACALAVKLPDLPAFRLSSIPVTMNAASVGPAVTVELSQPYSLPIQGDIVLTSEADTGSLENNVNRDDPRVRFSNGQRVVPFTIPAGARQISTQVVSTGTVASSTVIKLVNVRIAGVPVYTLPSPRQFRVARTAPVITNACFTPAAGGVNVVVTGYSSTRQITNASVVLTAASGAPERSMTVDVSGSAYDYFASDEAVRNGGGFTLTLPFTVEGGELGSASLELTNASGSTAVRSLQRCR